MYLVLVLWVGCVLYRNEDLPGGNHPVSGSGIPLPQVVPQTLERLQARTVKVEAFQKCFMGRE